MELLSKDYVEVVKGGELELTQLKKDELILKAQEFLGKGKKEFKDLQDELEQYCVFTLGEHYTSRQLGEVIEEVIVLLSPELVIETPIVEEIIK